MIIMNIEKNIIYVNCITCQKIKLKKIRLSKIY